MDLVYSENSFDEQEISCSDCGWKGTGRDTNIVDLYGVSKLKEIHCPECDAYLAGLKNNYD